MTPTVAGGLVSDRSAVRSARVVRRTQPWERWTSRVIAAGAGAVAATSGVEPTGLAVLDEVFAFGVTAAVALISARARRWAWLVGAGVAALAVDTGPWLVVAGVGLALAFVCAVLEWRPRIVGVVIGACAALGLMQMPQRQGLVASSAAFVLAILPLAISGVRNTPRRSRRRIITGLGVLAACVIAGILLFTVAALESRAALQRGLAQARIGFDAAREGDTEEAALRLDRAADAFRAANNAIGAPWVVPAQLVPGVRQHVVATETLVQQGQAVAAAAADVLDAGGADVLAFDGGVVDLTKMQTVVGPLDDLVDVLARSGGELSAARSPWLLAPFDDRMQEMELRLADARDGAALAADAVRVVPGFLGADGPKRYVVAFVTPVEARGRTGFMGNFGVLTVDGGAMSLGEFTRTEDFERQMEDAGLRPTVTAPADYVSRYARFQPGTTMRNIQLSPDFPSIAQVISEVYPQAGGAPVDGVISLDPWALAALLEFTGPISVPGVEERLTADNAVEFLVRDQYVAFEGDRKGRVELLEDAAQLTFERLNRLEISGPRQLVRTLGPTVEEGHLVAYSSDEAVQQLFTRIGVDGALPTVRGDFLSVVTNNFAGNKIDLFLEREIDYRARFDPETGAVEATVTVTMRNNAPASGLPGYIISNNIDRVSPTGEGLPLGYNRSQVSIYSPLLLMEARRDGEPVSMQSEIERDRWVHSLVQDIPPGGQVTLELDLAGVIVGAPTYRLDVAHQPLVTADRFAADVTVGPARVDLVAVGLDLDGQTGRADAVLDRDRHFELALRQ